MKEIKYSIGDIVYFIGTWTDTCHKGSVIKTGVTRSGDYYATVVVLDGAEVKDLLFDDLYDSEQECEETIKLKGQLQVQVYCQQINSVRDLVNFMYTHHVSLCEEYTDWNAREACKLRAEQRLGMKLN